MISEEILKQIKSGANISVQDKFGVFEGTVIARKHGSEKGATFTVRATVAGVDVEKIYPIHSPLILKIKILSSPKKVHRSKLYFLRKLSRKQSRQKIKSI
ncbi:MAG: 50S ribosomal protein L19 [Candidatus Liptonbacteria bacterium]|nr:50S ribosomal protein L19 [Candidatus Liptonbacteria bacterium]